MCLNWMSWVQLMHNAAAVARSLGCQCKLQVEVPHLDPPPGRALRLTSCLRKGQYTHGHPHDARLAARLGRIIYSKQVHHLGSARAPGNAGYSAFQHKKDARNLAGRAQKLPPARLLPCYDRARLRSSWRIIATISASRETDSRFLAHAAT